MALFLGRKCGLRTVYPQTCWAAGESLAAPASLMLPQSDGNRTRFEDMEEGMTWIREKTGKDARVLCWWDHGDELSSLTDRVTYLDASGFNLSQVAAVGAIMALPEEEVRRRRPGGGCRDGNGRRQSDAEGWAWSLCS
eukprot:752506-Hanusia_phi.AAC.10